MPLNQSLIVTYDIYRCTTWQARALRVISFLQPAAAGPLSRVLLTTKSTAIVPNITSADKCYDSFPSRLIATYGKCWYNYTNSTKAWGVDEYTSPAPLWGLDFSVLEGIP